MLGGPDLLWGGVLPGIVAAATLAVVWRVTGKAASAWRTAFVLGYLAGHWTLNARDLGAAALLSRGEMEAAGANWAYDPRNFDFVAALTRSIQVSESQHWLPLLAILALLPDAIACVGKFGPAIGWVLRIALCAFLPWRLLHGSKYLPLSLGPGFDFDLGGWSTGQACLWIGGLGVAILLAWQVLRMGQTEEEQPTSKLRSVLAVAVGFASVITMVAAKSLVLGQLLGVVTAALAGCALASALLGTKRGPDAAAGPIIVVLGALLIVGQFFATLTLLSGALLLSAMALTAGWLPTPASLSSRNRILIRCAICLLLLATPVILSSQELAGQIPAAKSETNEPAAANPYENFKP